MARNLCTVLILVSSFFGSVVFGYPTPVDFDGQLLRWSNKSVDEPLFYEIIAADDTIRDQFSSAIDDSATLWSSVPGSYIRLKPATDGQVPQISIKLESSISGGEHSAGYSSFDGYDATGPTHCEIYIAVDSSSAYVSFSKTALHELGHCLGLGHSLIPEAIMSYELDKNRFGLDIDDKAAVSRLYPADGSKPKLPPGCAISSPAFLGRSVAGQETLTGLLILLFLPLVVAQRPKVFAFLRRSRSYVPGTNP